MRITRSFVPCSGYGLDDLFRASNQFEAAQAIGQNGQRQARRRRGPVAGWRLGREVSRAQAQHREAYWG